MKITLKDGSQKEYDKELRAIDVAYDISEGLARNCMAARIDGEICDLRTVIDKDCSLELLTAADPEGLRVLRHTTSHVLAQAVKNLYPEAKLAIGPAIDEGFYYDFDMQSLSREDLDAIEAEMKKIIKAGAEIKRFELPKDEAIKLMQERGETYKVELIEDLPEGETISFYEQGDGFVDLCAGPHIMKISKSVIKAFKLTSSSGAYWRGDEHNAMLTRIYGTAFASKEELEAHLAELADRKNRDHNKLGREMQLFTTADVVGQGLPLLMPKGYKIMQKMIRWIEDLEDNEWGYERTKTPFMAKPDLYKQSQHWYHYKEGMFVIPDPSDPENEDKMLALRPMTCPFQYYVFKATPHSYRDMPHRYSETSTLFRNEDSGEMHGLTRVRQFTLSEGHLIVRPDQMVEEFKNCLALAKYVMQTLGVEQDVTYRLSKWDPANKDKYIGDAETWEKTQQHIRDILTELDIDFYEADGEAAFYGPKVDINTKNVYGKDDTVITVQWDEYNAELFDMYYIDEKGEKTRPAIIHRSSIGSYERTLAWLTEKYAGKFPTWLCPEQVRIIPISEKYFDYAEKVAAEFKKYGIDHTIDRRSEKMGFKIREARLDRLPYMVVVGEKEEADRTVSVRSRFAGDEGVKPLQEFIDDICEEIRTKTIRQEEPQKDEK